MSVSLIDSYLSKDVFGSEEMRRIFDENNSLQKWLDVECALARAESQRGIIPEEASEEICAKADIKLLDKRRLKENFDKLRHPLMAVIKELQMQCRDGLGEYIHWGATTQDIMDTALILQIKEAFAIILEDLREIVKQLFELAIRHRTTIMIGRTHGQHALPITFGFKVTVWATEIQRHIERLEESQKRVLVGQLSGAVGTMASFNDLGLEIQELMMKDLKLGIPEISWHSSRDRIAELVNILTMVSCTIEKIANEVYVLQKTEVEELKEHFPPGKISSSTMPHKRNPSVCETIRAMAKIIRCYSLLSAEAMISEHERDNSILKCEWIFLPEFFVIFGGILKHAKNLINRLEVNPENMKRNLKLTKGLILSERVMLALAKFVGRQKAHEVIYNITVRVSNENVSFEEALLKDEEILKYFTKEEILELLNPESYIGLSSHFVDRIVRGDGR